MRYDHTQTGPLYLLLLLLAVASFVATLFMKEAVIQVTVSISSVVFLLLAFSFRDLTVSDQTTELLIAFGPLPIFKRRLQYSEIERVETARSTLMDGLGIHMSPSGGWVWNLWGYDCVDVWYRQGRKSGLGPTIRLDWQVSWKKLSRGMVTDADSGNIPG